MQNSASEGDIHSWELESPTTVYRLREYLPSTAVSSTQVTCELKLFHSGRLGPFSFRSQSTWSMKVQPE